MPLKRIERERGLRVWVTGRSRTSESMAALRTGSLRRKMLHNTVPLESQFHEGHVRRGFWQLSRKNFSDQREQNIDFLDVHVKPQRGRRFAGGNRKAQKEPIVRQAFLGDTQLHIPFY
jgi:hypothetical protein